MHELSIALSIVDLACEELARLGPVRVEAVHLRLGSLAGVVKDALAFSFDAAASGTAIDGARLTIVDVPAVAWCEPCSAERTLAAIPSRRCPTCGRLMPELRRGAELELVGLEVIDA